MYCIQKKINSFCEGILSRPQPDYESPSLHSQIQDKNSSESVCSLEKEVSQVSNSISLLYESCDFHTIGLK